MFCPQVGASRCLYQLGAHTHPTSGAPHATLQNITNPKLARDLGNGNSPTLVNERRIAGDHEEAPEPREFRDDVFCDAVGENLLFRIGRHVLEWEHCN